jgi:hypothetical protein
MNWFATFLTNLLSIKAPQENMSLQGAELGVRGAASPLLAVLIVLAILAFGLVTFLLYFTERGKLTLGRIALVLLGVPLIAVAVLVVALLAQFVHDFRGEATGVNLVFLLAAEVGFLALLVPVLLLARNAFAGEMPGIIPATVFLALKYVELLFVVVLGLLPLLAPGDWPGLFPVVVALAVHCAGLTFVLLLVLPRFFLPMVRFAALSFLILLLLRPVLLLEFQGERPRGVALLLDDTKSMRLADKRMSPPDQLRVAIARDLIEPKVVIRQSSALLARLAPEDVKDVPRVELVKAVLGNPRLKLVDGLKKYGPLRAYLFGEDLRSELEEKTPEGEKKDLVEQLQARLTATQNKTALGDAILKLLAPGGGELPAAIVVVTDGLNNAGNASLLEAAEECRQAQVPLYIYGVGSSEGGTLQLIDATVPETIFYDDIVSVPVRWKAQGFKPGKLEIKAWLGSKEVVRKELDLRNGQDLREVLTFTPRKIDNFPKDNLEFKVSVQVKDNPQFQDTMKRPIRLSDSKVKVLYVENTPRWEYRFLQTVLLRDRRVQPRFVLAQGDPRLMKTAPFLASFPTREELLQYDLIILGDVPASYLGKDRLEWIQEFVRDFRGGLIVLSGRGHMPSSYAETQLAEVLPVEFLSTGPSSEGDQQRPVAYKPKLTRAGETASMLQLADVPAESRKIWEELPGFFWHYPVTKLRPGATALLVHPHARMAEQPMPLIATQYYGKGQVVFLATDETWRWRKDAEEKHFTRFWGQLIYQLALPHLLGNSSQRVQIALERSEAVLDREGYIFARLLDREFRPITAQEVPAELEYLDAPPGQERVEQVLFQSIPGRPGML